jgi:hypothetical protein
MIQTLSSASWECAYTQSGYDPASLQIGVPARIFAVHDLPDTLRYWKLHQEHYPPLE